MDHKKDELLIKKLDSELEKQRKLHKAVKKDLEEYEYYNIKKENGDYYYFEEDPLLPKEYYIKNGKNKHFSNNIRIWKQQEIYDELHENWDYTMKKFRILQKKWIFEIIFSNVAKWT